jgi:phosphoglycolate phosphatase
MKKIDLMIFDLDGTLAATGQDLVNSVNYALRSIGLQEKSAADIISCVGDGVTKLVERSLGTENLHHLQEALNIFSDHYGKHLLDNTFLYPGVEEVLLKFSATPKVILTNKRYHYSLAVVRGLGIEKYFLEIIGADSMPFLKPDRRQVEYLLQKYNARRENTVMIGDGGNDIIAAKNSGIMSLILLNGLGDRNMLLEMKADFYCEDIREIMSLFEGTCAEK